ncbi:SAPS-domain-containing protein [Piedraia hortae CBS 480.64]|uniref:SAPS-domain-containing protein n=1 Tax=Piedraia hortae CBS 480.64 TaxID=1314780 RepID=A0A6A7BXN5_9PEZI|nr:SAPS-domain-containing protein [Piedraia hortae CBS 480.64]
MFWKFSNFASISTLDSLLDKPNVTLEELLNDSDLVQELKHKNNKLVSFLRAEPVLKKLLRYVVAEPEPESESDEPDERPDDKRGLSFFAKRNRSSPGSEAERERNEANRTKYAYVACEVLSCDIWSITEALVGNTADLREFWQYVYRPAPLDPVQAGYFTRVNEVLFDRKTEDMLALLKSLDGVVPAMLQHVDCPMIMDLLLKIISMEKQMGGAGVVDWLQSQQLIPLLLGFLSPEHPSATQTSAGDFLKAIITISANATTQDQSVIGPNELTRQLVSEECIRTLIKSMLQGGNSLLVSVGIVIEVIRKNNSDYDLDNQVGPEPKPSDPIYLGYLLRSFANHIGDFMHLIRSPEKVELQSTFGTKIERLGFDRFKTCELMAELLHCSNMGLLNERGADENVKMRDAERERLKAAGRFIPPPIPPMSPMQEGSTAEFGSSVDSHGFHHARRPSLDEKAREILSDEDGFEKVNVPADMDPDMPRPLSPTKKSNVWDAECPTKVLTGQLDRSRIDDDDTVMTGYNEPGEIVDGELDVEKPAPLFAKKRSSSHEEAVSSTEYRTETDGSPVVGDFLKMQFVKHHVVPTILDFFFRFPWNNFLHNVVYDVVQQVFNGPLDRGFNRTLAYELFRPLSVDGASIGILSTKPITNRIMDGQTASDISQKSNGLRLGYMGHLTLIAEEVGKFGSRVPLDPVVIQRLEDPAWIEYMNGSLAATRERDNAVLGGVPPEQASNLRQTDIAQQASSALTSVGIGTDSFDVHSASLAAGFADDDHDDEEPEDDDDDDDGQGGQEAQRSLFTRLQSAKQPTFSEDEQVGELSFDDEDMDYR